MGLFSKHKDEKKEDVPKVPPVPSANSSDSSNQASPIAAPVPEAEPPKPTESPNLSSPPAPPGIDSSSLDDIKNQVVGSVPEKSATETPKMEDSTYREMPSGPEVPKLDENKSADETNNQTKTTDETISFDSKDDDLFDFSNLDTSNEAPAQESSPSSMMKMPSNDLSGHDVNHTSPNLNFVNNREKITSNSIADSFFVTTSQYKNLMEIIDKVKERVKESSDSHLRLLDIKAEEDVEYDNLRKDFQFIEDKLYEVDGLIFDK